MADASRMEMALASKAAKKMVGTSPTKKQRSVMKKLSTPKVDYAYDPKDGAVVGANPMKRIGGKGKVRSAAQERKELKRRPPYNG